MKATVKMASNHRDEVGHCEVSRLAEQERARGVIQMEVTRHLAMKTLALLHLHRLMRIVL